MIYRKTAQLARSFLLTASLALPLSAESQQPDNDRTGDLIRFSTDTSTSSIEFSVRFMGLSRVFGEFANFTGQVWLDSSSIENSTVRFSVDVSSIDTDNHFRDDDLSENWFEMGTYPASTFESDSIRQRGEDWTAYGRFTLKNVTRAIAIPLTIIRHREGAQTASFEVAGRFVIDRMDYGVDDEPTSNSFFDASKMIVGDKVTIDLNFKLILVGQGGRWHRGTGLQVKDYAPTVVPSAAFSCPILPSHYRSTALRSRPATLGKFQPPDKELRSASPSPR